MLKVCNKKYQFVGQFKHRLCSKICQELRLFSDDSFVFSSENFIKPNLPSSLKILDIPLLIANDENLNSIGCKLMKEGPNDYTTELGNFEIVKWPLTGWRQLDPDTGDEAGTTCGEFDVRYEGWVEM